VQHHLAVAVKKVALQHRQRFTEAAPPAENSARAGAGHHRIHLGYTHREAEHRAGATATSMWRRSTSARAHQVVIASLAIVQPQWKADRIRLITVNGKKRAPAAPASRRANPAIPRRGSMAWSAVRSQDHVDGVERQDHAVPDAAADGGIADRLKATGQVINVGRSKEFAGRLPSRAPMSPLSPGHQRFKPKN
jgi:hypothetical protein